MSVTIWLIPDRRGGRPGYESIPLAPGRLAGPDGPLRLGSDSRVSYLRAAEGDATPLPVDPGRLVFVQLLDGFAGIEGERVTAGDGLQITDTPGALNWLSEGAALIFDMPR